MLPRGRVALGAFVLAFVTLLSASCSPTTAVEVRGSGSSSPLPTPVPTGSGGIPMLGTTPPSGLLLPTYFVTLSDSTNGMVGVLTAPGSRCDLSVSAPSGETSDYPTQIVGANGTAAFMYPAVAGHGQSIQTVRCVLGDNSQVAKGQALLP